MSIVHSTFSYLTTFIGECEGDMKVRNSGLTSIFTAAFTASPSTISYLRGTPYQDQLEVITSLTIPTAVLGYTGFLVGCAAHKLYTAHYPEETVSLAGSTDYKGCGSGHSSNYYRSHGDLNWEEHCSA